jgi:hypothetical protein
VCVVKLWCVCCIFFYSHYCDSLPSKILCASRRFKVSCISYDLCLIVFSIEKLYEQYFFVD